MTTCPSCGAVSAAYDKFCSRCGANQETELQIAAMHNPALNRARGWILAVGILYAVGGLLLYAMLGRRLHGNMGTLLIGTNLALCAIHIGLWVWAKQQPYAAAVVALVLFISVHLVNAILDPTSIIQGLLIKVIFIVVLAKAVSAGKEAQRLRVQSRPL